jgi:hypothetical protein
MSGAAQTHLNLWQYRGNRPSYGEPVEVVVKEFCHVPYTRLEVARIATST